MWAIGAAIPWLFVVVAQTVWFVLDGRLAWLHVLVAVGTVLGIAVSVVVGPLWRYRVHRWDVDPTAVYTRSGWWVQERRIAPISRVQTVDTYRGPLDRAVRAGQRDGDDGVVGRCGADRRPGLRRR